MKSIPLNISELINQFNEHGYLVLPEVLSQEKVARLNSVIDEVIVNEPETLAHNIYNSVERHAETASLIGRISEAVTKCQLDKSEYTLMGTADIYT